MSKSLFKMRDSAGEFPAAPYLFWAALFPTAFRKLLIAFFSFLGSCCDLRALSYGFQWVCFLLSKQEGSYIQGLRIV